MYNYQKILDPNEKVYFFGGMHWIVMSGSFAMLLITTFSGLMIDNYLHRHHDFASAGEESIIWNHIWSWLSYLPWVFIAAGVFWVIGDSIRDNHLGEKDNNPAPVAHADMGSDIAETASQQASPSTEIRDPLDFLGDTVEKAHALNVLSEDLAFLHKMRKAKEKEKTPPAKPKLVHSDKRSDAA